MIDYFQIHFGYKKHLLIYEVKIAVFFLKSVQNT